MIGFALLFERFVLVKLITRFDKIQEYIFLLTIGWCLGMAELAKGAFIGGVVLASNPIAPFIAESLKPVRDFFLVIFFFTLGANLDLGILYTVLVPSLILAGSILLIKPFVFKYLMVKLNIAIIALHTGIISHKASSLIQAATIMTFVVSSYIIVQTYPTPIAVSDRLRRD